MSESFTVRTDDRDWFAEFAPEPAAEHAPKTSMLADATSLPVITRRPASPNTRNRRTRERKRTWPVRSMLLIACAMVLLALSGTLLATFWFRTALSPVPVAEWPVSRRVVSAEPSRTATLPVAPELPPESPATENEAAAPVAPPAVPKSDRTTRATVTGLAPVATGNDVSDILTVIERYRLAQSSLNPGSVRAVVPAADMRALANEFAYIKRQTLAFDNCKIDVQGDQADAACAGRISVVPKTRPPASGSDHPGIQSRHWTFTLVHSGSSWTIQSVAAR